jgi:hypothetical protein
MTSSTAVRASLRFSAASTAENSACASFIHAGAPSGKQISVCFTPWTRRE